MLAMRWTEAGRRVHMVIGLDQLSTRMYTSFAELVAGWEKNLWTAGRHLLADNAVIRGLARVAAPLGPLIGLVPAMSLLIGLTGIVSPWWMQFGALGYAFSSMVLARRTRTRASSPTSSTSGKRHRLRATDRSPRISRRSSTRPGARAYRRG